MSWGTVRGSLPPWSAQIILRNYKSVSPLFKTRCKKYLLAETQTPMITKLVLPPDEDPENLYRKAIKVARRALRAENKIELLSSLILHFPCNSLQNNLNFTFLCHLHLKIWHDAWNPCLHERRLFWKHCKASQGEVKSKTKSEGWKTTSATGKFCGVRFFSP